MLRFTEIGQTVVTAILLANSLLPRAADLGAFRRRRAARGLCRDSAAGVRIVHPEGDSDGDDVGGDGPQLRSGYSVGAIVSPAVAGMIATQLSPSVAYSIDLVTFVASLVAVFMLRAVPPPENAERPSFAGHQTGVEIRVLAAGAGRYILHRHRGDVLCDAAGVVSGTRGRLRR